MPRRTLSSVLVLVLALSGLFHASGAFGELIHQENFEGNDSGYTLNDPPEYAPFEPGQDWSPGIWGLNDIGPQIGLQQNAPARRAAILWDGPNLFADDIKPEALDVWVSLVDWAVGVQNPAARKDARIGVFPSFLPESLEAIRDKLVAAGYSDSKIFEVFDPLEVDPAKMDLLIHSNEQSSTAFSTIEVPLISFSGSDHDDAAIVGIGQAVNFPDDVVLQVPEPFRNHPALGGHGADGVIEWTGPASLQGMGKTHNGGKAIAEVEYPDTGQPGAAIFVIEEGAPLLGAFNPDPEGDHYFVGAALNKFGIAGERILELKPVNVTGKTDVRMTVLLAATAADFENGDYLRIEADPDGNGPKGTVILDEFYGVDEAHDPGNASGCLKGLSNGSEPGAVGDICLPAEAFGEFTWNIPAGATDLVVRFAMLNTWGNEIVGIDNIRIHTGPLEPTPPNGDFNGNGMLDVDDINMLNTEIDLGNNPGAFDLTGDGKVDFDDLSNWVNDKKKTWIGDANLDGEFNSSDFVQVFQRGEYEDNVANNAGWDDGDWNGDREFDTSDFVVAFQAGGFERGPRAATSAVPEPSGRCLLLLGLALLARRK